jgi:Domain of unknown function (DUF6745)
MAAATDICNLRDHLERWTALRLCCSPADREGAEHGIELAYAAAGLARPQRIIWCASPLEIARQMAAASADAAIGANVKAELFDLVRNRIDTLAQILWKDIVNAALELSAQTRLGTEAIGRAVVEAANAQLRRLSVRTRQAVLRMRGVPSWPRKSAFGHLALSPDDLASLSVYAYLHDVRDWREDTECLYGLWKIAASAGWLVPHERVCWVCERPDILLVDAQGRLHSADGPALRYRDGWSVWAWKGVQVPAWAIEDPERITVATLEATLDSVLRRCLIDIMTPERLIASGAATPIAQDAAGILWGMTWQDRGGMLDKWCAVEVVDATPGTDGTWKHYVLPVPPESRTARGAVAWTYGLNECQYARLQLRT